MEIGPSGNNYLFPIRVSLHSIDYIAIASKRDKKGVDPFLTLSYCLVVDEMDS